MISEYFKKKIIVSMIMGFVAGVPLLLTITVLQAWLTDANVSRSTVGLFLLVGLPYSLKFLWAPIFDRFIISRLGRRRGWLLVNQILLMISIAGLGLTNPAINLTNVAVLSLLVAFFSASQDIVIDAYRRESLEDEEQTLGASAYVLGYRVGMILSGGIGLILADYMSYQDVYMIMSSIIFLGILTTIISDEPKNVGEPSTFITAVINPFIEFFSRHKNNNKIDYWVPINILMFILLYKVGDTMAHALSTNFYLELGFSKTEVGAIGKFFGTGATIFGALIAGFISIKIGLYKSLILFGIAQAFATLGFTFLAIVGDNLLLLITVITAENLAAGMGYTAYLAFIANMTNKKFTATQFALMTALMSLPRTLFSATSGYLVDVLDWELYFVFCSLIALPALIILKNIRSKIDL